MKPILLKLTALTMLPAALLCFTSCSTPYEGEQDMTVLQTKDGAMVLDTYTVTADVTAIDANRRRLTLATPDGKQHTLKAGPGIDLGQLRIGERITATATEELAVFLRKSGTPTNGGEGAAVTVAARGQESAVLTAATQELTTRVAALNLKSRLVTLKFADGSKKTLKIGPKVDLANVKVGDDVTVQIAESLAIDLQKP